MTYTPTEELIMGLIDTRINRWAENMKNAVQDVKYPKFSGDNTRLLYACSMFSYARDAARKHAAATVPNQILDWGISEVKSWAPPALMLSKVSKIFDKINKDTVEHHNKILSTKFEKLRDDFIDQIDDSAKFFVGSPYATEIYKELNDWLQTKKFRNIADAMVFIRCLMDVSNFIAHDSASVRERVNLTFETNCRTVYHIYLGSNKGPSPWYTSAKADNDIFIETRERQYVQGARGGRSVNPRIKISSTADQVEMMASAWRWTTSYYDDSNTSYRSDTTIVREREGIQYDANGIPKPQRMSEKWIGPKLNVAQNAWAASRLFRQVTNREVNIDLGGATPPYHGTHPGIMVPRPVMDPWDSEIPLVLKD